jgi:hypothetical protein
LLASRISSQSGSGASMAHELTDRCTKSHPKEHVYEVIIMPVKTRIQFIESL